MNLDITYKGKKKTIHEDNILRVTAEIEDAMTAGVFHEIVRNAVNQADFKIATFSIAYALLLNLVGFNVKENDVARDLSAGSGVFDAVKAFDDLYKYFQPKDDEIEQPKKPEKKPVKKRSSKTKK